MKIEGRMWFWVVLLAVVLIAGCYFSYTSGRQSNVTTEVEKQLAAEKVAIQKEYKDKLTALETERNKYKADYDRLKALLVKKAKERADIKPPKDIAELKERSEKLGYPVKEIRP